MTRRHTHVHQSCVWLPQGIQAQTKLLVQQYPSHLPCSCHILQAAHARMAWRCLCISGRAGLGSTQQEPRWPAVPDVRMPSRTTTTGQPSPQATSAYTCNTGGPCCCCSSSRAVTHSIHNAQDEQHTKPTLGCGHNLSSKQPVDLLHSCTLLHLHIGSTQACLGIPAAASSLCRA